MAWNRPSENGDAVSRPLQKWKGFRFPIRCAIAGAVVIVGVAVAAWFLWPEPKRGEDAVSTKRKYIKEGNPAAVQVKNVEMSKPVATNLPAAFVNANGLDPSLFPYTDGRKVISSTTNSHNQIIDICIMPSGRDRKVIRRVRPPMFKHVTDQLIAMAISGENDMPLPPLPIGDNLEVAFLESLKTPIEINPDDSEKVKDAKRRVMEAREFMDQELRAGRSFKSVLEEHLAQRKANAQLRSEAMAGVRELRKSGDAAMVNEYVSRANEMLRKSGVREIDAYRNPHERRAARESLGTQEKGNQ